MRIQRYHSRLRFRRRRRRTGCFPTVIFLGLLMGVGAFSWQWLQARILGGTAAAIPADASIDERLVAAEQTFNQGDLGGVIQITRGILSQDPYRSEAIVLLARALIYRSYSDYNLALDRQVALDITSTALEHAPSNVDLLAIHAFALSANGNPAAAAQTAERALAVQPEYALARAALALAYGNVGSFEVALRESQRAAEGPGWMVDALRALAISYSDLGDYESAIHVVDRAIGLNPRLTLLYFEKALYALQLGNVNTATQAYYQILTYDGDNVKVRLRLCELSSMMRERETAIRYCQEVTQMAPSWSDAWYQLGREYFLQGNFAAARDHLHRCSALQVMQGVPVSERRFECWYLQGQAAEILGDCDTLLTTYHEFRAMAGGSAIQETWTYPPEGPPGCAGPSEAQAQETVLAQ